MKLKEIRYQRVKNLGNYESERLELVAYLDDDDDAEVAIAQLKDKVYKGLDIPDPEAELVF